MGTSLRDSEGLEGRILGRWVQLQGGRQGPGCMQPCVYKVSLSFGFVAGAALRTLRRPELHVGTRIALVAEFEL